MQLTSYELEQLWAERKRQQTAERKLSTRLILIGLVALALLV